MAGYKGCTKLLGISDYALAEHKLETSLQILFNETKLLSREPFYYSRKIREAIEIHKCSNNLNRDDGSFSVKISPGRILQSQTHRRNLIKTEPRTNTIILLIAALRHAAA
ncbi:hypothetical protein Trydic_g4612 [Trypoxylus dichotomus]